MIFFHILLPLLLLAPVITSQSQKSNATDFIATSEWQEIKPGKKELNSHENSFEYSFNVMF